jgi:hypothetical protein
MLQNRSQIHPWRPASRRPAIAAATLLIVLLAGTAIAATRAGAAPRTGFTPNLGQTDGRVAFYGSPAATSIFFTEEAIVFDIAEPVTGTGAPGTGEPMPAEGTRRKGSAIYLRLEGIDPGVRIEGRGARAERSSFFYGADPTAWRTSVPLYDEVVYRGFRPGVDVAFRLDGAALRYRIERASGAPQTEGAGAPGIGFRIDGPALVQIERDGSGGRIVWQADDRAGRDTSEAPAARPGTTPRSSAGRPTSGEAATSSPGGSPWTRRATQS